MMNNGPETFGINPNFEASKDPGMMFGNSHLSFSTFTPCEFPPQRPDETDREFAEREMRVDERIFMVGLLRSETEGPSGMVNALKAPDFKVKRRERREFTRAVGKMSEEEYATRVNSILGIFTNEESRKAAMDIADHYWFSGKRLVAEEEPDPVKRTHFEKPRRFRWKVEEPKTQAPERPITQAEVMINNPQKYYREEKQVRRSRKFLDKIKETFNKFRKEDKTPRRPRSGVDPSDFPDRRHIPTPQVEVANRPNGRRYEDDGSLEIPRDTEEPEYDDPTSLTPEGYPEAVPAGKLHREDETMSIQRESKGGLFEGTNFYHETEPGHYFKNDTVEAKPGPEAPSEEPSAIAEPEPRANQPGPRFEEPIRTRDFSFGEEGAF